MFLAVGGRKVRRDVGRKWQLLESSAKWAAMGHLSLPPAHASQHRGVAEIHMGAASPMQAGWPFPKAQPPSFKTAYVGHRKSRYSSAGRHGG